VLSDTSFRAVHITFSLPCGVQKPQNPAMKPNTLSLVLFVLLTYFALSPKVQAVNPPPDGGYPNFTTAAGDHALQALTSGVGNTALGTFSLFSVTTGSFNTAVGAGALDLNTADSNTATGAAALLFNTTGSLNTAVGGNALVSNLDGADNTAIGVNALFNNTTGMDNTATGVNALADNVAGFGNIAIGNNSMANNVSGSLNTVVGDSSGGNLVNGIGNIYIGAIVAPSADESGTIRMADNALPIPGTDSHVFIAGIGGSTVGAANTPVVINAVGQLGTLPSSARFKKDIESMDKTSEAIYSLRPVTFHYKGDETNTACSGLIAEEVAKVDPSLILLDKEGKPQTVRYEQINAMLLNEFLKEHKKVEEQQTTIRQLKKDLGAAIEQLTARLDEQATQIQKASAQLAGASPSGAGLGASKFAIGRIRRGGPAPQVVNNP
jgi:Chaperone of endosialidase